MKVLLTRDWPAPVEAEMAARFELTKRVGPLSADAARTAMAEFDAIACTLGDDLSAAAFPDSPRCRLLANFGVGVNHIDLKAAAAHGVQVSNTPGAVTDATADIAIMLLLMAARRASEGERLLRAGRWVGWGPTEMLGRHVTGMTVGIVGLGRIGTAVARRAHYGFRCRILHHSRTPKGPGFPVEARDLLPLMAESDAVIVTVPGGAATRGLIGREAIAAMRPDGILVNVARGDVVDEEALIEALEARRIWGAGLDVYAREPQVPERLRSLENAALIPHLGTAAVSVREDMGRMALANLVALAEGRAIPNAAS